jgi:hypothetical protein
MALECYRLLGNIDWLGFNIVILLQGVKFVGRKGTLSWLGENISLPAPMGWNHLLPLPSQAPACPQNLGRNNSLIPPNHVLKICVVNFCYYPKA